MTLNAADIDRLAGVDKSVTIHGDTDDQVVLEGGSETGRTEQIGDETYNIYSLGNEGEIYVYEHIQVELT